MRRYVCIWYDTEEEKARDIIEADSQEEARLKAFKKYNGNPPASQISVVEESCL